VALTSAVAAAVSLGMNPAPPETLVAKAVHLVDDNGDLRVLINARAGVSLLDARKRPRAVLSVDRTGPGLALYGESSRTGVTINVNGDGPALAMRDSGGRTRALLAAIDQGPALILSDEDGRERITLVERKGQPVVGVLDRRGAFAWRRP
jgi:hypothetical protein